MSNLDSRNPSAGIGDPYWYEWMVGLLEVVNMLDPASGIKSVILQDDGHQGIDDVVVEYENNRIKFMQIKHTRREDSLTFGDLISNRDGGNSLLAYLSQAWKSARSKGIDHEIHLFTNRKIGKTSYTLKDGSKRPALQQFLDRLNAILPMAVSFDELVEGFEDGYTPAWQEWCSQLTNLVENEEKLLFLQSLKFYTDEPDLPALENEILERIQQIFKISKFKQYEVLKELVNKLRIWTTSLRGVNTRITRKIAYEALCLDEEEPVGWHGFSPPEPFFESSYTIVQVLENELLHGNNPIVFFQGLPGSGKTSIVSKLCQKGNIVDLRFHAFYPITPDTAEISPDFGSNTTPEALWGDMLVQLRRLLNGQLHEYRVPLRKDFLTVHQLRDEVLRISSEFSQGQGKKTTILCIDGIDHAARSNVGSFLNSLIPPEKVPSNVRFLIVGQPPTDNYPVWLKNRHSSVTIVNVAEIKEHDVAMLLHNIAPNFEKEQQASAVKLIIDITQGNTLACVFAVYEASLCEEMEELEERLYGSCLHSDLSTYYEQIWEKSVQKLPPLPMMLGEKLAACLSLSSEKLSGEMLHSIFKQAFTAEDGTLMLQRLFPLVIQDDGGYRVMHNDVRVFLRNWLQISGDVFQQTASMLADYYWLDTNASSVFKHKDLFHLLKAANRESEQAIVFNVNYVLEAWKYRRSSREILKQSSAALIQALNARDWNMLHEVLLAVSTVDNIYRSVHFLKQDFDHGSELPPLLVEEKRVIPLEEMSHRSFFRFIKEGLLLARSGGEQRALEMLDKWLGDQNPEQIMEEFIYDSLSYWDGPTAYNESLQKMLRQWGQLYGRIGKNFQTTGILKSDLSEKEDVKTIHRVEMFNWAYLDESITIGREAFQRVLYDGIVLSTDGYEQILQKLVCEKYWLEVGLALQKIDYYKDNESVRFIQDQQALWALLSEDKELIRKHVYDYNKILFYLDIEYTAKIDSFALRCLVYGYLYQEEQLSIFELAKEANELLGGQDDLRESFFLSACIAGRMLKSIRNDYEHSLPLINEEIWEQSLNKLLVYKEITNQDNKETRALRLILWVYNIYSNKEEAESYKKIMHQSFLQHVSNYPYDHTLEHVWNVLSESQNNDVLIDWARVYTQKEGVHDYSFDSYEEMDLIDNRFAVLLQKIGLDDEVDRIRKQQYSRWSRSLINSKYCLTISASWLERCLDKKENISLGILAGLLKLVEIAIQEIEVWNNDSDFIVLQIVDDQILNVKTLLSFLYQGLLEQSPAAGLNMLLNVLPQRERSSRRIIQGLLSEQVNAISESEYSPSALLNNNDEVLSNNMLEDPDLIALFGLEEEKAISVEMISLEEFFDDLKKNKGNKLIRFEVRIYEWSLRLSKETNLIIREHIEYLVENVYIGSNLSKWRTKNGFALNPILDQLHPEQVWRLTERIIKSIIQDSAESFFDDKHLLNLLDLIRSQTSKECSKDKLLKSIAAQEQWLNLPNISFEELSWKTTKDDWTWESVFAKLYKYYQINEVDNIMFERDFWKKI